MTQVVSGISQFTRQNTAQMISQRDLCSCLFKISSSIRGLILLRAILMSFATLRRLRYVVLILTRADRQLHRGMLLEMELMLPELSLLIQDTLATFCTKIPSVIRS